MEGGSRKADETETGTDKTKETLTGCTAHTLRMVSPFLKLKVMEQRVRTGTEGKRRSVH